MYSTGYDRDVTVNLKTVSTNSLPLSNHLYLRLTQHLNGYLLLIYLKIGRELVLTVFKSTVTSLS